jgi:small subunit ribosomal protein S18
MPKVVKRVKNKDNSRRSKKKVSILTSESVKYIDYKDVNLLRRFMSDRAKIRARRVSGNDDQQQREIARAIKNAREMALLPYASRVTTQRGGRDRGERGDRGDRGPRGDRPDRGDRDAAAATAAAPEAAAPVIEDGVAE